MNITTQLPAPLNSFVVDVPANQYYDFELAPDSTGEDPSWTTDLSVIQRIGKPEEIAAAISFLLSDDASYITGQVLAADKGFMLK